VQIHCLPFALAANHQQQKDDVQNDKKFFIHDKWVLNYWF
jgi:hypothetical protein